MHQKLNMSKDQVEEIYVRHSMTIYRICFTYMKNPSETQDAVSETFCRLIVTNPVLSGPEHEKAWLIKTAINICKDMLKHWWRRRENIEDYQNTLAAESDKYNTPVLQAVLDLPNKYRDVVYLYYVEGYTTPEIADLFGKPQSTVRYHLQVARKKLREKLREDFSDEK